MRQQTAQAQTHTDGRLRGTVVRIVRDRGFCFIKDSQGKDYFCHMSAFTDIEFESVREGLTVTFEARAAEKGPRAEAVSVD